MQSIEYKDVSEDSEDGGFSTGDYTSYFKTNNESDDNLVCIQIRSMAKLYFLFQE